MLGRLANILKFRALLVHPKRKFAWSVPTYQLHLTHQFVSQFHWNVVLRMAQSGTLLSRCVASTLWSAYWVPEAVHAARCLPLSCPLCWVHAEKRFISPIFISKVGLFIHPWPKKSVHCLSKHQKRYRDNAGVRKWSHTNQPVTCLLGVASNLTTKWNCYLRNCFGQI